MVSMDDCGLEEDACIEVESREAQFFDSSTSPMRHLHTRRFRLALRSEEGLTHSRLVRKAGVRTRLVREAGMRTRLVREPGMRRRVVSSCQVW